MKEESLTATRAVEVTRRRSERVENVLGTLMASGPFIGYVLFSLLPMALSLYLSFTDLKGFNVFDSAWIGLANYKRLFKMEHFYLSIGITLYWSLNVPINLAISLFIANLLTKPVKCGKFVRSVLFIPTVCSTVAVTLMWQWILDPGYGIINTFLAALGLPKIGFTSTAGWFMPSTILISIWMYGTNIVLMQSALANVDESFKEAARIDGAREMRVFWSVTFPSITPTLFYLLITRFTAAFGEVGLMQVITSNGVGPGYMALTLSYYMYRMGYINIYNEGLGLACSCAWVMAIAIILFTRLNFRLANRWVCYD